jgi:hypothetical protein
MESLNPRGVLQHSLEFHADLLGQFEKHFSESSRVTLLEDDLPYLQLEIISFLAKLEPNYANFSCRGAFQEISSLGKVGDTRDIIFLLRLVFENIIALVTGYHDGKSVALFEEGYLGFVTQSTSIGDVVVRPLPPSTEYLIV